MNTNVFIMPIRENTGYYLYYFQKTECRRHSSSVEKRHQSPSAFRRNATKTAIKLHSYGMRFCVCRFFYRAKIPTGLFHRTAKNNHIHCAHFKILLSLSPKI